jgi:hypothetical protein
MRYIAWLFVVFFILSCNRNEGVATDGVNAPSNEDFQVRFLFEKDGIKIYRFKDAREYRYFSIGNGCFIPSVQKRVVTNGEVTTVEKWTDGVECQ